MLGYADSIPRASPVVRKSATDAFGNLCCNQYHQRRGAAAELRVLHHRIQHAVASYKVIGSAKVSNSEGTYSYRVVQGNVSRLKANDSVEGALIFDFEFTSPTKGGVAVGIGGGTESGTFAISGPNFAFVQGRVLIIHGTDDPDSIAVNQLDEHNISVTRNNITQNFDEFEGDACVITSDAGNDTIRAETLKFPTTVDWVPATISSPWAH